MATALSLHDPLRQLQLDLVALLEKSATDLGDRQTPLATRVHELRKRLKRARAWAQLLPKALRRQADRALRDVHRSLGNRRDIDATLEAIARLQPVVRRARGDGAVTALAALRHQLAAHLAEDTTATSVAQAGTTLAALAATLAAQPVAGDFPQLSAGMAAIARRSRKAMRRALASGDPEQFHRWRKWMKYHMFHLRYATPLWPDLLRVQAIAAEHTAEWLGQSQDLELVRDALARATLPAAQRRAALAVVDREQRHLLRLAASAGLHLHAESPRALACRLDNYWLARAQRAGH